MSGYSVIPERDRERTKSSGCQPTVFVWSLEEAEESVKFQQTRNEEKSTPMFPINAFPSFGTFFHIPVFIEVSLLACPIGFQLVEGKCVCHLIFRYCKTCSSVYLVSIWHSFCNGCGSGYCSQYDSSVCWDNKWPYSLCQCLASQQNHISSINHLP